MESFDLHKDPYYMGHTQQMYRSTMVLLVEGSLEFVFEMIQKADSTVEFELVLRESLTHPIWSSEAEIHGPEPDGRKLGP